jgi:hypothetical protein
VGKSLNTLTSNIPFVGLAQGLLSSFFGQGGLGDWLSPAGIINELKSALFGRFYRGGQYQLGEKFKYYILGDNIHTRDADIVTDPAVMTAITTFSVGFGVPVTDIADLDNLTKGADAYISRYIKLGVPANKINRDAVNRAVLLKSQYFPGYEAGNYSPTGVAPTKWDPNNFNKIPYVAPIPDFTAKNESNMFDGYYSGAIPDGKVSNGIVLMNTPTDNQTKQAGFSGNTILILALVSVGAYMLLKKKR